MNRAELVDLTARALADFADDGCFERVAEWEATPKDERVDDNYPGSDIEDVQWYRDEASAVLDKIQPHLSEVSA